MKVKELIAELQKIENQDKYIHLLGNTTNLDFCNWCSRYSVNSNYNDENLSEYDAILNYLSNYE